MSDGDFKVSLNNLKRRDKSGTAETIQKVDRAGEAHGFIDREPRKRRGRPASPRTGQVHAKVIPAVSAQISEEAKRRGVQQGVLIEEAWELYCRENGLTFGDED